MRKSQTPACEHVPGLAACTACQLTIPLCKHHVQVLWQKSKRMRDYKGEAGSSSQHIVSPETRALHECQSSLLDIVAGRSPPSRAATGNAYASNSTTAGRPGSCSSVRSMRSSAALSEVPSSRLAPANGWYASPVLGSYSEVYRRSLTPYSAFKQHDENEISSGRPICLLALS